MKRYTLSSRTGPTYVSAVSESLFESSLGDSFVAVVAAAVVVVGVGRVKSDWLFERRLLPAV